VFALGYVTQFDYFTVMMLSPWAAPLLRALDKYLKRVAESTHQPYRIDSA
jgi:hypothetical protein